MSGLSLKASSLGIGLLSMATLMLELLVNKALSFSTWGSLGYMIIGSAIFGFCIAGVLIALWKPQERHPVSLLAAWASLVFSGSSVLAYFVMNLVPFNFEALSQEPFVQMAFFSTWYLALLVPFTATGFVVSLLLLEGGGRSNRLYAADLVGAGLGCLAAVPLFPVVGAGGEYLCCAAIGALAASVFASRSSPGAARLAAVVGLVFALAAPVAERVYPVRTHQAKRERWDHLQAGYITRSLWSFLAKIEVAQPPDRSGMLWFDGGMMQSSLDPFDGDYAAARQAPTNTGANSIAYRLRPCPHALIIAPSGGRELRSALAWGAGKVTAVELDRSVVRLVREDLDRYLGGIFNHPRVRLVNDEGRSFVRRSAGRFDVIQFVSAYSVTAIHSGAVDLADSYLVTVEAFDDYLGHLTPGGILAISKDYNLRLLFTAWEALESRGLDPRGRIVLIHNDGHTLGRNTLLASPRPFSTRELASLEAICRARGLKISYAPPPLMERVDATSGLASEPRTRRAIEEFLRVPSGERRRFYERFPFRVSPVTDDRPFFGNTRYLFQDLRRRPEQLTEEIREHTEKSHYLPLVPAGVLANLVVLAEAAVFALLFLLFPLWRLRSDGVRAGWQRLSMLYFLALGVGFIWIEIVLLKWFILFLGNPVFSIAAVLSAMLVSAGLGSLVSERLPGGRRGALVLASALAVAVLAALPGLPWILREGLALPFAGRVAVGTLLIAPLAFLLGMPFPLGLRYLSAASPASIPWAWAVNGYGTVVGVSAAALIAPVTGFSNLLLISLGIYLLGFLALRESESRWAAAGA